MRVRMAAQSTLQGEDGSILAGPGEEIELDPLLGKALVAGHSAELIDEAIAGDPQVRTKED